MPGLLAKLAAWIAKKLVAVAVIIALALAVYGGWLFLQDEGMFETERVARMQEALARRDQLLAARDAVERRVTALRADLESQKVRARQAEKVIARLRELESWWDRWFGNRTQQSANTEQLQKMEGLKAEAMGKWSDLQRTMTQVIFEKDGLEKAVVRANVDIAQLEASESRARRYIAIAWASTKGYIALALGIYFLGPALWSLLLFYGVAPILSRGAPIQLGVEPTALPMVSASRVSLEARVQPGEVLRIKEKYLQASDEGIARRTRFVLDWQIPLTSLACGLVELVELENTRPAGEQQVTLSSSDDPHMELAAVSIPAGGSLILRPSFLAGVIQRKEGRLHIRRHWRIFRWQGWISGQFRFFEFVGPCHLIVSGSRGVRVESLSDGAGGIARARRTNQDATIGFTPNLVYRPVRAETFWSYFRGMNPLFDDVFAGRGLFILQETAGDGPGAKAGRWWSTVWGGVLKVFGL